MISPELVQAGIITKLKADTALIAWLTTYSAQNEVRENQWQGRQFVYPAVRVDILTQTEPGNPPCYSQALFNVFAFAEGDSSKNCGVLAGLVDSALIRKKFTGTGFDSGLVTSLGTVPPIRTGERVWQALGQYQANLFGGDFDAPQA
jgi:hypothetical protein